MAESAKILTTTREPETRVDPPPAPGPSPVALVVAALGALGLLASLLVIVPGPATEPALVVEPAVTTAPQVTNSPATSAVPVAIGMAWRRVDGPGTLLNLDSLVASSDEFFVLDGVDGAVTRLWSSPDGEEWTPSLLDVHPSGLIVDGSGLLAFRDRDAFRLIRDGDAWGVDSELELPAFVRAGYRSARPGVQSTSDALLVHSVDGELFHSTDGREFAIAVESGEWWVQATEVWERFTAPTPRDGCRPRSSGSLDYPPIVESQAGLIALLPAVKTGPNRMWPICEPELWTSDDGSDWFLVGTANLGDGAFVYDVAHRNGRFVAVGGLGPDWPSAWVSDNQGRTWVRLSETALQAPRPFILTKVESGPFGWVALGEAVDTPTTFAWMSRDGRCWQRMPDHVQGQVAAVGADRVLLADFRQLPSMWVGTFDPGAGFSCST